MSAGYERIREERVVEPLPPPVEGQVPGTPIGPYVAPVSATTVRSASARTFAVDSVIAALVGLALLVVGLLAMIRAGLHAPLNSPVTDVLGFHHTAALGIVEAIAGLLLLASGAARSRGAALFFGTVLGIGAFIGVVQTHSFAKEFALERGWAWIVLIGAALVVLSALLLPRFYRQNSVVTSV